MQRFEPALRDARPEHLIRVNALDEAFQYDGAEVAVFEQITDQSARSGIDDDRIWFGERLQARREIRGLPGDSPFLYLTYAGKTADNHQTGTNADASLQTFTYLE